MSRLPTSQAQGEQAKADRQEATMQGMMNQPAIHLEPHGRGIYKVPDFPAKLIPRDGYDEVYQDKMDQLTQATNMYNTKPQVVMNMGPEDFDYVRRKRHVQNKLAFDKWMTTAIDLSDPTQGKRKSGSSSSKKKNTRYAAKLTRSSSSSSSSSGIGKAKRRSRGLLRDKAPSHRRGSRN